MPTSSGLIFFSYIYIYIYKYMYIYILQRFAWRVIGGTPRWTLVSYWELSLRQVDFLCGSTAWSSLVPQALAIFAPPHCSGYIKDILIYTYAYTYISYLFIHWFNYLAVGHYFSSVTLCIFVWLRNRKHGNASMPSMNWMYWMYSICSIYCVCWKQA